MEYKIHEVEWTDEKVARFWDFQHSFQPFENTWFTDMVGKGIISYVHSKTNIEGKILDYGAGKGHLMAHLLELKKCEVNGFDFSPESKNTIDYKYKGTNKYLGTSIFNKDSSTITPFETSYFDFVFLIEAIEHITEQYLHSTLNEIYRILKPGGVVIITTPNNENLDMQKVICPDCGCLFHRVQHLRSFTAKSLEELLTKSEFRTFLCTATDFEYHNNKNIKTFFKKLAKDFKNASPHLIYIGKK